MVTQPVIHGRSLSPDRRRHLGRRVQLLVATTTAATDQPCANGCCETTAAPTGDSS